MRLDLYLYENGLAKSRTAGKLLIEKGLVLVNGAVAYKASTDIDGETVTVTGEAVEYVSRGGLKLAAALDSFDISVEGAKCLDIGASTGGFTDCLLRHGAGSVLCVDCGHGQLDPRIASDPRVTSLEGFNARDIAPENVGVGFDVVTIDVSFISQTLIHDAVSTVIKTGGTFISLIKPQFEVGRENVSRGGIVKRDELRRFAIDKVCASAAGCGFITAGVIDSPIEGGDGNREFLACFTFPIKE